MRALVLFATTLPVLALAIASTASLPTKLVYNGSQSAPIGFYWIDRRRADTGDFVLARVPNQVRNLVEERLYLPPDVHMIKQIMGADGDVVCRKDREILVNGVTVTVARYVDVSGRALPVWRGCQTLDQHRVLLIQRHLNSFDGRYFGPTDRSLIVGRAIYLHLP